MGTVNSILKREPFSVCFNLLKIKYVDFDDKITVKNYITDQNDKVNLFINLESVLQKLSNIYDLENKVSIFSDKIDKICVSNIINLIAHYKRFFTGNGLDTKVYIYNTSLDSKVSKFNESIYNKFFRSYYLTKYNENPKIVDFTNFIKDTIFPETKTYCEFIPDVYFIESLNIEGSLIPYIIGNNDTSRKNIIITTDMYETQYELMDNYIVFTIHRSPKTNEVCYNIEEFVHRIYKKDIYEIQHMMNVYEHYPLYVTLLSVYGSHHRNINTIAGMSPLKLYQHLDRSLEFKTIDINTSSVDILMNIFDDIDKEMFKKNFYTTNLLNMYKSLTDAQIKSVLSQISDRLDTDTLFRINKTRFADYPMLLEALFI